MEKNPFISSDRLTDINFGYPHYLLLEETIRIVPGCKTVIPENISLILQDPQIQLFRQIKVEDNAARITIMFVQNTTQVPAELYGRVRDFYREMIYKLNEPLIITFPN